MPKPQHLTIPLSVGQLKLTAGLSNQIRALTESGLVREQKQVKAMLAAALDERIGEVDLLRMVASANLSKLEALGYKGE